MINPSNQLDIFIPPASVGNKSNPRSQSFISNPNFQKFQNEYIRLPADGRTVPIILSITAPPFEEVLERFKEKADEPSELSSALTDHCDFRRDSSWSDVDTLSAQSSPEKIIHDNESEDLSYYQPFQDSLKDAYNSKEFIRNRDTEAEQERVRALSIHKVIERFNQEDLPNQGRNSSLTITQKTDPMDEILTWCEIEAPNFKKTQEQHANDLKANVSALLEILDQKAKLFNQETQVQMEATFSAKKELFAKEAELLAQKAKLFDQKTQEQIEARLEAIKSGASNPSLLMKVAVKVTNILMSIFG